MKGKIIIGMALFMLSITSTFAVCHDNTSIINKKIDIKLEEYNTYFTRGKENIELRRELDLLYEEAKVAAGIYNECLIKETISNLERDLNDVKIYRDKDYYIDIVNNNRDKILDTYEKGSEGYRNAEKVLVLALLNLNRIAFHENNYGEVLAHSENILKNYDPVNALAFYDMARVYYEKKDFDNAEKNILSAEKYAKDYSQKNKIGELKKLIENGIKEAGIASKEEDKKEEPKKDNTKKEEAKKEEKPSASKEEDKKTETVIDNKAIKEAKIKQIQKTTDIAFNAIKQAIKNQSRLKQQAILMGLSKELESRKSQFDEDQLIMVEYLIELIKKEVY